MANYRAKIIDSEAAGDGTVHFDCWIQREEDDRQGGTIWVNVEKGHRSVVLQASAVLAVTQDGSLSDGQKRSRLAQLFRQEALSWGIDEADAANEDIMSLIPSESWPVNVNL